MTEIQHRPIQRDPEPCEPALWGCECGWNPPPRDDITGAFKRRRQSLDATTVHCLQMGGAAYRSRMIDEPSPGSADWHLAQPDPARSLAAAGVVPTPAPSALPASPRQRDTDALLAVTEAQQRLRASHDALRSLLRDFEAAAVEVERRITELARIMGSRAL